MVPTPANLKSLDAITGQRQRIPVEGQPSLYVQVTGKPGSPVLSWVFRYRVGKQQVNHTLGSWPELGWPEVKRQMIDIRQKARAGVRLAPPRLTQRSAFEAVKAAEVEAERLASAAEKVQELIEIKARRQAIAIELGEAPAPAAPADTTPKVREIAEKWYAGHVLVKNQPMTQAWQRWALDKYVLPQLGELKITELKRSRVFAFLDGLSETPVTANRVKALISKLWSWSEARDETETMAAMPNPTRGWDRNDEEPRERRLSISEIQDLGKAYAKAPTSLNRAAIFCLLTGCREGAVIALEPGTKLDDGLLRFDAGLSGLKGCRRVYVPPVAAALLKKVETPVLKRSLWRSWSILRKAAGLDDVSIHDLRRTFASIGVDQGHDEAVIDVLLGHSRGKIKDTYMWRSDPVLAKVAAEVSDYIAVLLGIGISKPKAIPTETTIVVAVEEPSTGSKANRSPTPEPSVGVKAARMSKKSTKAATPTGKAKLFKRPQK
jgi:integrase